MVRTREAKRCDTSGCGLQDGPYAAVVVADLYAGRRGGVEIALPVALYVAARPQVIGVNVVQALPLLPAVERTPAAHHVVVDPVGIHTRR